MQRESNGDKRAGCDLDVAYVAWIIGDLYLALLAGYNLFDAKGRADALPHYGIAYFAWIQINFEACVTTSP